MMRLPFAKGLWLTVVTGVVIVGLALAGVVASLGCGGGGGVRLPGSGSGPGEGEEPPDKLWVEVRIHALVRTAAGVPLANQFVQFAGRAGPLWATPRTSDTESKTTDSRGSCWYYWSVRVDRGENVYVLTGPQGGESLLSTFTWSSLLGEAQQVGSRWESECAQFVRLTVGGGLEDP